MVCLIILGQFTVPFVSGQSCSPTSDFTINKISQNKGIMFGGATNLSGHFTNIVCVFKVSHNTIVSYCYYLMFSTCAYHIIKLNLVLFYYYH